MLHIKLNEIASMFEEELEDNLVGIYVHGSYAMGCFNPQASDIDLIVVIKDKLHAMQSRSMTKKILALREQMTNEIELSVVCQAHLTPFIYPTPIEYHYSDMHRENYMTNEHYVCGGYLDYDFASQYAIAYHRGIVIYGEPLSHYYEPVDNQYYIASIIHDIKDASEDIIHNPIYTTLNLCRVLYFLRQGIMSSKKEGGDWGCKTVSSSYQQLVHTCLQAYIKGLKSVELDQNELKAFAVYMLQQIKGASS